MRPDPDEAPWMVVANVVRRRLKGEDHEVTGGTSHFRGGAKLWVAADYPGMCETVVVIGRDRHVRWRTVAMRVWLLSNLRLRRVHDPEVLRRRAQLADGTDACLRGPSEADAAAALACYRQWTEDERRRREDRGLPWWVVEP